VLGQLAAMLWELIAVSFLVLVALTIRKARARGKRLFVDLPAKRLGPPPAKPPYVDHRWDVM
jgi:hypothetical protein